MPRSNVQYTTINDFRPGIISNARGKSNSTILLGAGITLELPPGAARVGTVDCYANQTGQLVPLASFATSTVLTAQTTSDTTGNAVAVGATAEATSDGDAFFHAVINNSKTGAPTTDVAEWWMKRTAAGAFVRLKTMNGVTGLGAPSRYGVTFVQTRGRRSAFASPGFPIVAMDWTSCIASGPWNDTSIYFYEVFPDPNNLTADGTYEETAAVNNAAFTAGGQLVGHSGRILRLLELAESHGSGRAFYTNERVRYTDPPNSVSLIPTSTDSILDPQYPGGYGSWGSISYGELLLVKQKGGAILVEGDVYAPSITRLPGVRSTDGLINPASFCMAGLVYGVANDGVYLWEGGSTSRKINKLPDEFFGSTSNSQFRSGLSHTTWGQDLVVFGGGPVYDSVNDAWWMLSSSPSNFVASANGYLFSINVAPDDSTNPPQWTTNMADRRKPAKSYTWKSQPIPESNAMTIDVSEVIVSLSKVWATVTMTIKLSTLDGLSASETTTLTSNAEGPIRVRLPIACRGNSVELQLSLTTNAVASSEGAPIVNSIAIGWSEAGPLGQNA